jgi:hypothetical protein
MVKSILLKTNGEEFPCVILVEGRQMFPIGREVVCFCNNQLFKGYIEDDDEYVAEIEVLVEFVISPELSELLL